MTLVRCSNNIHKHIDSLLVSVSDIWKCSQLSTMIIESIENENFSYIWRFKQVKWVHSIVARGVVSLWLSMLILATSINNLIRAFIVRWMHVLCECLSLFVFYFHVVLHTHIFIVSEQRAFIRDRNAWSRNYSTTFDSYDEMGHCSR